MATNNYKAVSFADRQHNPKHNVKVTIDMPVMTTTVNYTELDEQTGRVVTKSKSVLYDPAANLKKYKFSDFCTENLIASGAINNMRIVTLSADNFTKIDNIEQQLSKIETTSNPNTENPQ